MTRPRRRTLVALAVLLGLGFALPQVPRWSASYAARLLARATGRQSSVERVAYRLSPLGIEITGLRVAGKSPDAPPFLTVRTVRVIPSLPALWGGKVTLWKLEVDGARLLVHTYRDGTDDLPALGGGGAGREVEVRRLVVTDSEAQLDDTRVPLWLELPRLRMRLAERDHRLTGHIAFGPGPARVGDGPPMDVGVDADVALAPGALEITKARVGAAGTELAVTGVLGVRGRLRGRFAVSGPVDLAFADTHVLHSGLDLAGTARYQGSVVVESGRVSVSGQVDGTEGRFDGQDVPRFAGLLAWDPVTGVTLKDFEIAAWGGRGTLDVRVDRGEGQAAVAGDLVGMDAEPLLRYVFDIAPAGLGADASGHVDVRWPRGHGERISGALDVELTAKSDARTPLSGHVTWRAEDGLQTLTRADLRTPTTQATFEGRIGRSLVADLAVSGQSQDLAATDELGVRLRRALGVADADKVGFAGRGRFSGHWGGTLRTPVVSGQFEADGFRYLDVDWGHAQWTGTLTPDELRSTSLLIERRDERLTVSGRSGTGGRGHDTMDLTVAFYRWPAQELLQVADSALPLTGDLTGEARISGERATPKGTLRITAPVGRFSGVPFSELDADVVLRGTESEVKSGRAAVGGGRLRFRGTVTADDVYDGQAALEDVELGVLLPELPGGVRWGGRLSGQAHVQGPRTLPRGEAHLTAPRVFLGDEGVGALALDLTAGGDGHVNLTGTLRSARVDFSARGEVSAAEPYVAALHADARETSFDPFVRLFATGLPETVGIVASGSVDLGGPLLHPAELTAHATVPDLAVLLPEYPVKSRGPVRLTLAQGTLSLDELHLAGEGTDLAVAGHLGLVADRPMEAVVRGDADLRALRAVARPLRGEGAARLTVTVSGTPHAPKVDGRLEITGGGLRVRGFPHGLTAVRGTVAFNERSAQFSSLTGVLGGGAVDASGQASWTSAALTSFDTRISGHDLSLRYPEGLKSLVDADLRLFGDASRQWATGTVDVRSAVWTRRYDVASELLATRAGWEQKASLREGVHLDVRVKAPDTLRIDNNLATLTARADLQLQGTTENPVVLGRAEIERGRVYFQGNTYVIRRGTVDFANPQRVDPLFDIEAETRLRSYRVSLKVNGTLERVYPSLSSDPPLNPVQIVTLLAGGDETTVDSLTHATSGSGGVASSGANLAATGAATLAAGRLSEQVGLEREAERLLGLNRFSIDPSLVRGGVQNPTARLTLGKRVTPDLSVLYSVDLRGSDERLLSLEYNLSDQLSLLLTFAEPGGYGFDVRRRQSR